MEPTREMTALVIREAQGLIDEPGTNPEYERGVVELSMRLLELGEDDKPTLYRLILGREMP